MQFSSDFAYQIPKPVFVQIISWGVIPVDSWIECISNINFQKLKQTKRTNSTFLVRLLPSLSRPWTYAIWCATFIYRMDYVLGKKIATNWHWVTIKTGTSSPWHNFIDMLALNAPPTTDSTKLGSKVSWEFPCNQPPFAIKFIKICI